jgi:hypothetical protein
MLFGQLGSNKMDKISAAVMLALCGVMLVRLLIGERRRRAFDARGAVAWAGLARQCRRAARWWPNRRYAAEAARDAIRRASADVPREGNVYRPGAFRGPRKPH